MLKMKTAGAGVTTRDAGVKLDKIVYGAAVVSGLVAGLVGRGSPGLAGLAMYLSLGTVVAAMTLRRDTRLWKALLWLAILMPLAVAPTRLIGIALREMHGAAFHLDAIAQTLSVGWMTLAAAWLTVKVLSPRQPRGGQSSSPIG